MKKQTSNIAHSVQERVLNLSKLLGLPYQQVLLHLSFERFLYRLGKSATEQDFILKGAVMLYTYSNSISRKTSDIDFTSLKCTNDEELITACKCICSTVVDDDGFVFLPDSVEIIDEIKGEQCKGYRIRIKGYLGQVDITVKIDIGLQETVYPEPISIIYPSLIGFKSPTIIGYAKESIIAEKFAAMILLGLLNSRMSDFYDIWQLAGTYEFDGTILQKSIQKVLSERNAPIDQTPTSFTAEYAIKVVKDRLWTAFITRNTLTSTTPSDFREIQNALREFLLPILQSIQNGSQFLQKWTPELKWVEPE